MGERVKLWVRTMLVAGLFWGSAAPAQEIVQADEVSYALSLIDAGADGTATSKTGGVVTDATQKVRVKMTVSVPRSATTHSGVTVNTQPARLMFRKHKGPATAFDGSIVLVRDAPYGTNGLPYAAGYYPMPQAGDAGQEKTDPTQLNYTAVVARSTTNLAGTAWSSYVLAPAQEYSPARWECTYLSAAAYDISDMTTLERDYPMIASLLNGQGSYEWYAASRYGLGSVARISDIQDLGRKMSFTDRRLWEPVASAASDEDAARIGADSKLTLGTVFEWKLRAMPKETGWHLYHGAIGANANGDAGAQLLSQTGADSVLYTDFPRIESPVYPDGISSVSFQAQMTMNDVEAVQQLLVQCKVGNGLWQDVETLTLSDAPETFTVDFAGAANGSARFRLVRVTQLSSGAGAQANLSTMVVRDLLVRSATPTASFGKPLFTPVYPAYTVEDDAGNLQLTPVTVSVAARAAGGDQLKPRGYKASLDVRRRAEGGDTNRIWHTAPVTVDFREDGSATLGATFTRETLMMGADGGVNAKENAFFYGSNGKLTGLLPGVYDLKLNCQVLGSFKAGRTLIDEREASACEVSSYTDGVDADGAPIEKPYVMDYRERETAEAQVFLRVTYRSGTTDATAPYTLKTRDFPLLPSAKLAHTWRVDVPTLLRVYDELTGDRDETARYAWGYQDPADPSAKPVFEVGYLSFKVGVVTADGRQLWFGQRGASAAGLMPTATTANPAVTELLMQAASEEAAVPLPVTLDNLDNSHVMVEVTLPAAFDAGEDASARIGGSFWQDFNDWYAPTDRFSEMEYRVTTDEPCVGDFNCTLSADKSQIDSGWYPDEGPFANKTSFTERFEVGRGNADIYTYYMGDASALAGDYFAAWGASHEPAWPKYLRIDGADSYRSTYLDFNYSRTEVVLNRSFSRSTSTYFPDAQIRLRGTGSRVSPRTDGNAELKLSGAGTVSFTLGLSLPYDLGRRAQLISKTGSLDALNTSGVAAGVELSNISKSCASSGYSVSYFLEDPNSVNSEKFELRLTQTLNFPESASSEPVPSVVAELYRWTTSTSSTNYTAARLPIVGASGAEIVGQYQRLGTAISGNAFGVWVDSQGYLRVGTAATPTPSQLNYSFRSRDAVASTETGKYRLAVGSAECRPVFRRILRMENAADTFAPKGILVDDVQLTEAVGNSWKLEADTTSTTNIKLTRRLPSADSAGRVKIIADSGTTAITRIVSANETGVSVTATLGVANGTLTIMPYDDDCNVFIDNLYVSSWCGNDYVRNGNTYVPAYTNKGFFSTNGFAGVGLWVRPKEDRELNASKAEYSGDQCVLMQRSRRNAEQGNEVTQADVTHTGDSLAIYFPYSEKGFGPVRFSYRIPTKNEYASGDNLPVTLMLQYCKDSSYYNNYLGSGKPTNWVNASEPLTLQPTDGEWYTASITPKVDGQELVGKKGTLRLVMVTSDLAATDDPYVYIDDVYVNTNEEGATASWAGQNVRLITNPINQLYWKDRTAATAAQTTFAEKSALTPAFQFNNATTGSDCDAVYGSTYITSPELPQGVGRVTFAARLTDASATPVRLYITAAEDAGDPDAVLFKPVTYVEVTNTVYTTFEVDLSKYTKYYTKPNADLSPSENPSGDPFSATNVKRLRLKAFVSGDGQTDDGFGNGQPTYGRVLIDQLVVSDPIRPSLRIETVAFSNVAGNRRAADFVRNSPLSQPVSGAPMMRAMVELGHAQLLRDDSIRVFLTFNPQSSDPNDGASRLKAYSNGYSYTDVMGNLEDADVSKPIYAWDATQLDKWPLSSWCPTANYRNLIVAQITSGAGHAATFTTEELATLGIPNTIELERTAGTNLFFTDDCAQLGLNSLPTNSLVQYNAWVIYQNAEGDDWYDTQLTPATYTDFPWYFPRSLNAEIRAKALEADENDTGTYFSPYYWVYSCIPGEVFINEFNLRDNVNANASTKSFVEICAPAALDIAYWSVSATYRDSFEASEFTFFIEENTSLSAPDVGAVPALRVTGSSSNRAFYTAVSASSPLYVREGGDGNGAHVVPLTNTKNGGIMAELGTDSIAGAGRAASLMLKRPTGGAEHIVCFANDVTPSTMTADTGHNIQKLIDDLYLRYQQSYIDNGFGSEWYQAFLEESWATHKDDAHFGTLSLQEPGLSLEAAHARRLTKANYFPVRADSDSRFVYGETTSLFAPVVDRQETAFADSIATVDMGGVWVTRKNAIDTDAANGPLDLTDLCFGSWPADQNPVERPRRSEPAGATPATNASVPYTQVTPRQINPDQYLIKYRELAQSTVTSTLSDGALGSHSLERYAADGTTLLETRRAGRASPNTWAISLDTQKVRLLYAALPFHRIETVSLRLIDAKSGEPESDATLIDAQLQGVTRVGEPDLEGWISLEVPADATDFAIAITLPKPGATSDEERYNVEAKAKISLKTTASYKAVITKVSPFCGGSLGGSGRYQPWWGSGFGFSIEADETQAEGAKLSAFLVTYPSPAGLANSQSVAWGLATAPWAGLALTYSEQTAGGTIVHNESLIGMEYEAALEKLSTVFETYGFTRHVELPATDGHAEISSGVGILGDTYAKAMGYDENNAATFAKKEPAIPFCVWGVYTCTVQSDDGNESVSFLLPQAAPGEKSGLFTRPTWYEPVADLNVAAADATATAPYFYLYSTPPQAAWLNELNLDPGVDGSAAYAEVLMPYLRAGITGAGVKQTTNHGWRLRRYTAAGAEAGESTLTPVADPVNHPRRSDAYTYNLIDPLAIASAERSAYVLIRPCGAAEGGVWSAVDATGGTTVAADAALVQNTWLGDAANYYVVPGKSDSNATAGAVQLVGEVTDLGTEKLLSSAVAKRTEWAFAGETKGGHNAGGTTRPDIDPEWNRVVVTSRMTNTLYGGVLCGYHQFDFFTSTDLQGDASTVELTKSGSGTSWQYGNNPGQGNIVLSYRPRTNYRFERLRLPPEMIGHVMLIGQDRTLSADEVEARVTALKAEAAANPAATTSTWLQMGSADPNGLYRATVEYQQVAHEDGSITREPSGIITFNPAYQVNVDDETTFGDQDSYVITIVFVDEPASAQNLIRMELGQGDVKTGAWLISQTLFAHSDDAGTPDETKGGDTVTAPIWSDTDGNIDGNYQNVHGWVYQPVVGDKLGMSAVINPELGLVGGSLGSRLSDVTARLKANNSLRPFIIWTLIPKKNVPTDLFGASDTSDYAKRNTFLSKWSLEKWIGSPSVAEYAAVSLPDLRRTLKTTSNHSEGFYRAAGIIPMTYRGFNPGDGTLTTDEALASDDIDALLAFSTMTEAELDAALQDATTGLENNDDALLPYDFAIRMENGTETLWQDGAILRFALVLADPIAGTIYDCQSISNFSSNELPAYCPWYIPDNSANINRTTTSESAGISPYAWVYAVPQGSVWINEIRPFAGTLSDNTLKPSVLELAMKASPFTIDADTGNILPEYSLDGWQLVVKYAPMPLVNATTDTPIDWTIHQRIDLHGWIPFRRLGITPTEVDPDPHFYDLDYYCLSETTDPSTLFGDAYRNKQYSTANKDSFMWLQLPTEEGQLKPILPYAIEAQLRAQDDFAAGVVYAISLVRNNGVIEDEVIFHASNTYEVFDTEERVNLAIQSENANHTAAGTIRGLALTSFFGRQSEIGTMQFIEWTDDNGIDSLLWSYRPDLYTLPGANKWNDSTRVRQPYAAYANNPVTFSMLSASLQGGDATLSLFQGGAPVSAFTNVSTLSTSCVTGTAYTLALSDWNTAWFDLTRVSKNGADVALPARSTIYSLSESGTLAATSAVTFEDTLLEDTHYALTFTYTPNAERLAASGALNSADDNFLAWLLRVDPDAILAQSAQDGVSAAEKYWLGLDSAAVSAQDVALDITALESHREPDGSASPALSISLKNGETPISELQGDGVLILLGKETLADEWHYLCQLYPEDVNGDTLLILNGTQDAFFKVILLSAQEAEATAR